MTELEVQILIAAYMRRMNHPTETEAQIMQEIIGDVAKIRAAFAVLDNSVLSAGAVPK